MKTKIGKALTACLIMTAVGAYAADKNTGITGSWATDAALTATKDKTEGGALKSLLNEGMKAGGGAVPGGNNRNGGFPGGGGGGGRRNFAQFQQGPGGFGNGTGGPGGGLGQGGIGDGGFPQGGGGFPQGGGIGGNRNRGVNIDVNGPRVVAKGESKDGVALTMTLTADKKKIQGEVLDVVTDVKAKIENGTVDGNKFKFQVYKKVGEIRIATTYEGELVKADTIALTRTKPGGDPFDASPDGTPIVLQFHRASK